MADSKQEQQTTDLWKEHQRDFIKRLNKMATRYFISDVFGDVCGMMASAIEKPFSHFPDECEKRYASLAAKYSKDEMENVAAMMGIIVEALELRHESFLGPILEEIGAANTHNQQYLTPASVATICARVTAGGKAENHVPGELVTLNDSACGAGVLLIAGAEELMREGVPQRDIFIVGGDIDQRACDITFVELSLLGYAARIDHMDALALKQYSRPRWTIGYFLHGTQWREGREKKVKLEGQSEGQSEGQRSEVRCQTADGSSSFRSDEDVASSLTNNEQQITKQPCEATTTESEKADSTNTASTGHPVKPQTSPEANSEESSPATGALVQGTFLM